MRGANPVEFSFSHMQDRLLVTSDFSHQFFGVAGVLGFGSSCGGCPWQRMGRDTE